MAESSKPKQPKKKPIDDGNYEKEIIAKHPDLELANLRYLATHPQLPDERKNDCLNKLQAAVKEFDMAPLYELVCADLGRSPDASELAAMKATNDKRIKEIELLIPRYSLNL